MADNTPPKGIDLSQADFSQPDIVRRAFEELNMMSTERFQALLREGKEHERKAKARHSEVMDAHALIFEDLGSVSGRLDRLTIRVARLDQERELPLNKIADLERRERERDAKVAKLLHVAAEERIPAPDDSSRIASKMVDVALELADDMTQAATRASSVALEQARAAADVQAAQERRKDRSQEMRKWGFGLLASLILLGAGAFIQWLTTGGAHHIEAPPAASSSH